MNLVDLIERWLDAVPDPRLTRDELGAHLAPGVRFLEHPNLVNPAGSDRDREAMLAGAEAGRDLLAWQRFEDRRHDVLEPDRALTRATWRGEVARDAGPLVAGQVLTAHVAMLTQWQDGRLVRQENFDCYEPW